MQLRIQDALAMLSRNQDTKRVSSASLSLIAACKQLGALSTKHVQGWMLHCIETGNCEQQNGKAHCGRKMASLKKSPLVSIQAKGSCACLTSAWYMATAVDSVRALGFGAHLRTPAKACMAPICQQVDLPAFAPAVQAGMTCVRDMRACLTDPPLGQGSAASWPLAGSTAWKPGLKYP